MKLVLTVASFFLLSYGFSQSEYDSIIFKSIIGEFKPINIEFKSSETAYYTLHMERHDSLKGIDSILVRRGQQLVVNLTIRGPCLYDHPSDYIPVCPKNHRNRIVPITYGLIFYTEKSKSKKGKFYSGGCIVTDCDPQFFCKKHKISF